jgi:hypothetical protein
MMEMDSMNNTADTCQHLRKLHGRLLEELRILKENLQEEEQEGVVNPIETANIIVSLQKTLNMVEMELQKCHETN